MLYNNCSGIHVNTSFKLQVSGQLQKILYSLCQAKLQIDTITTVGSNKLHDIHWDLDANPKWRFENWELSKFGKEVHSCALLSRKDVTAFTRPHLREFQLGGVHSSAVGGSISSSWFWFILTPFWSSSWTFGLPILHDVTWRRKSLSCSKAGGSSVCRGAGSCAAHRRLGSVAIQTAFSEISEEWITQRHWGLERHENLLRSPFIQCFLQTGHRRLAKFCAQTVYVCFCGGIISACELLYFCPSISTPRFRHVKCQSDETENLSEIWQK